MPKRTWILEILNKDAYHVRARLHIKDEGARRRLVTRFDVTPEMFDDIKDLISHGCKWNESVKVIDKSWHIYEDRG